MDNSNHSTLFQDATFEVYGRRWAVLVIFVLSGFANALCLLSWYVEWDYALIAGVPKGDGCQWNGTLYIVTCCIHLCVYIFVFTNI